MAVKIRLQKFGRKDRRFFRLVATDEANKRDGKILENLGFFDPSVTPAKIKINKERVLFWEGRGAKISEGARKILAPFLK